MRRDPEIERSEAIARQFQKLQHELQRQNIELERQGISLTAPLEAVDVPAELEQAFADALEQELAAPVAPPRAAGVNWVRG